MTAEHVDHTASYLLDVEDPASEEHWSIYRCDTCFALVASADAADHGHWHFERGDS